jgi:hypothetical protein
MKAIGIVENSLRKNKPAFSPSPPKPMKKLPSPLSPLGPPPKNLNAAAKRMRQHAAGLAAKRPKLLMTTKVPSPNKPKPKPNNANFKLSPSSGRVKVKSNSSGRWVYANLHFSMEELKALAGTKGVNIKGLRSKANIAKKIFT